MVQAITLHLPIFSVSTIDQQYNFGWSAIFIIVFTCLVNSYYIVVKFVASLKLIIKMLYNNRNNLLFKFKILFKIDLLFYKKRK